MKKYKKDETDMFKIIIRINDNDYFKHLRLHVVIKKEN